MYWTIVWVAQTIPQVENLNIYVDIHKRFQELSLGVKNMFLLDIFILAHNFSSELTLESHRKHCFSVTLIQYKLCVTRNNTEFFMYYSYTTFTQEKTTRTSENISS